MWDLWWRKWHWDRFFSEFFGFPLSVYHSIRSPNSYHLVNVKYANVGRHPRLGTRPTPPSGKKIPSQHSSLYRIIMAFIFRVPKCLYTTRRPYRARTERPQTWVGCRYHVASVADRWRTVVSSRPRIREVSDSILSRAVLSSWVVHSSFRQTLDERSTLTYATTASIHITSNSCFVCSQSVLYNASSLENMVKQNTTTCIPISEAYHSSRTEALNTGYEAEAVS
jgi:hypothetical protein